MSLERLNSLQGYHLDNCVLVLRRMNCIDHKVRSVDPEECGHGMTRQKWHTIRQSVISKNMYNK